MKKGVCPSCKSKTVFRFRGNQIVPKELWEAFGRKAIALFDCLSCQSTISGSKILKEV